MTTHLSESESLFNRAKNLFPGGVHSPVRAFKGVGGTPPFINKAKGVSLFDIDGNQYTDFCLSWGPLILGHQDPEVKKEVQNALDDGWSYGTTEPYSLELAEFIQSNLPFIESIRFVNSGTEAVMSALRVARAATKKDKIIKFNGCYHGHTDSLLVKAGSGLAEMSSPDSAGVTLNCAQDTLIAELNDIYSVQELFQNHKDQIAAVIIEPLPANNGLLPQTESFLKELQSLTHSHGALFILDEVISGFRMGFGGMTKKFNLDPDLVTYGKIIGGGFPVGAYAGKKKWMDLVAPLGPVYQAGTLSANPVAIRAGLATLKKCMTQNFYEDLESKTKLLKEKLLQKNIPIQTEGSLFWMPACKSDSPIRSINDIPKNQNESYSKLFHFLLQNGIYLAPSGYEVGFMSSAHSQQDVENLAKSIISYYENRKEI